MHQLHQEFARRHGLAHYCFRGQRGDKRGEGEAHFISIKKSPERSNLQMGFDLEEVSPQAARVQTRLDGRVTAKTTFSRCVSTFKGLCLPNMEEEKKG